MKFCFHHMRFDEVGTPLKCPETVNDNIKNLSKGVESEPFYFINLPSKKLKPKLLTGNVL